MKYWTILFSVLVIKIGFSQLDYLNDAKKDNLIGKVKTVTQTHYLINTDDTGINMEDYDVYSENNNNRITYNINGLRIKTEQYSKIDSAYYLRYIFTYNNYSLLDTIYYNFHVPDSIKYSKFTYNFDSSGVLKSYVLSSKNIDISKTNYYYNGNNQLIKKDSRSLPKDSLVYEERYKYDSYDNNIELVRVFHEWMKQKVIFSMEYNVNKLTTIHTRFYNFEESKPFHFTIETFNEFNLIQTFSENGGELNWEFEYEYDEQGNWIVKKSYRNNELYRVTRREITYYNP